MQTSRFCFPVEKGIIISTNICSALSRCLKHGLSYDFYMDFFFFKVSSFFFLIVISLIYLLLIYYLFFGCVGSSFLCESLLQLRQAGATLHRGARASHHRGLSCCGAQAPDAQAQQLWLTGLAAPRHVGSSQTRARTRVPCIGRQLLNHCATREALYGFLILIFKILLKRVLLLFSFYR